MAHELDFSTGQAAFAEFGDRLTAWHKHGRAVPPRLLDGLSGEQQAEMVLAAARLDWEVEARDVMMFGPERDRFIDGWKAYTRSDTGKVLTVAPESYTVLQNRDLLRLVEPMLDRGIFIPDTAGALREGADVWGLFRFNSSDPVVQEYLDEEGIVPYALVSNNHSRSRAVTIMETPVRVVCANTLGLATRAVGRKAGRYPGAISLRHTRNVRSASVEAVEELWGQITERYRAVAESYKALKGVYLREEQFEELVLDVLAPLPDPADPGPRYESTKDRAERRRGTVTRLWQGGGRGLDGDGSAWEAYNAAAEALDHYQDDFPTRGDRLKAVFPGGSLANRKQDVLNGLYELVPAGGQAHV